MKIESFIKKSSPLGLLFWLFPVFLMAQNQSYKVGEKPPALTVSTLFSPNKAPVPQLKDLHGHVVLLEFWATWCGPCVGAMEHLNKLGNEFPNNKLTIIAITNEDKEPVKRFLKNKPPNFYVALDDSNKTFDVYQPRVIPHSVLINPKGKISAITLPKNIKKRTIQKLLQGKSVDLPVKTYGKLATPHEKMFKQEMQKRNAHSLYKSVLMPANNPSGYLTIYRNDSTSTNYHNRRITADGVWPIALFAYAFDFPNNKIIDKYGLPEQGYYLDIILPKPNAHKLKKKMQELLVEGFGIQAEIKEKKMDAYLLKKIDGRKLKIKSASKTEKPFYTMRGPTMKARKKPISTLVKYLNNFTGKRPVIDKTELHGTYDYSLDWSFSNKKSLFKSLHELGLQFVKDKALVKVLILSEK